MPSTANRTLGMQRNKLLRYKLIKQLYNDTIKQHPYTPLTQILQHYIFPIYPISRATLYQILTTSITTELKKIEEITCQQTKLFD